MTQTPEFTVDWFSRNIPDWEKWLAEFQGKHVQALEIGCYEGRSALWLCDHILTHQHAGIECIDPYDYSGAEAPTNVLANIDQICRRFLDNTKHLRDAGKLWFHRQRSVDFLKPCAWRFDIIYIDGDHAPAAALTDAVLAWQVLRPGGVMILDDYAGTGAVISAAPAIDAFLSCFDGQYELLGKGRQVALRKTRGS